MKPQLVQVEGLLAFTLWHGAATLDQFALHALGQDVIEIVKVLVFTFVEGNCQLGNELCPLLGQFYVLLTILRDVFKVINRVLLLFVVLVKELARKGLLEVLEDLYTLLLRNIGDKSL